jgi:hypothetical protein
MLGQQKKDRDELADFFAERSERGAERVASRAQAAGGSHASHTLRDSHVLGAVLVSDSTVDERLGATPSDLTRVMTGDALLVNPTYSGTMAIMVHAAPEHIWPWLVQIGYRRGGLYSYDWLDRLFVAAIEPNRALVLDMRNLGGFDWVWQFGLSPIDEKRTRPVSRSRVRTQTAWARLAETRANRRPAA